MKYPILLAILASCTGLKPYNVDGEDSEEEEHDCVATGYDLTGASLTLPTVGIAASAFPFASTSAATTGVACSAGTSGDWRYSLSDMTGDGTPDLLVTTNGCEGPAIGINTWMVYEGVGGGFDVGVAWTLPTVGIAASAQAFASTSAATSGLACSDGTSGDWRFQLTDVTGDVAPDLLVTTNGCDDPALGVTAWKVYENNGAGFDEGAPWLMPTVGIAASAQPFSSTSASTSGLACSDGTSGNWQFGLSDITGDDLPDLLVTTNGCDDPALGVTAWKVYEGNGAGFEVGAPWLLPTVGIAASALPFSSSSMSTTQLSCSDGTTGDWRFILSELTGDGVADLLVTTNGCDDPTLGAGAWKVYEGNGAGFDEGVAWALPTVYITAASFAFSSSYASTSGLSCSNGTSGDWRFSLTETTGDDVPDLLVTTNGCDDPALGVTAWKVYAGDGAGFDDGVSWELPSTGLDASALPFASASASTTGQPCIDGTTGDWRFGLTDASGDSSADLLITTNGCEDPTIGVNTWKIYEANCE